MHLYAGAPEAYEVAQRCSGTIRHFQGLENDGLKNRKIMPLFFEMAVLQAWLYGKQRYRKPNDRQAISNNTARRYV